ncbi:MAG: hypothetical protein U1E09_11355 [Methylococcales bacterium]|nr:hypothetical protein [Methylobacter sp.]MDP2428407.1 hypothetical protein [Methylobacter sp.]MDP3055737.1 hypothetical protein [Methylobacter sp.]MDP3360594.1 hypothetical protein [Methylobacter sp.]MDZ4157138.1 hypothetical protein [Methylococcales bacterium]
MALLKKLVIASFVSTALLAAAPAAMAKPATGKIENQSQEGVLAAFDESIAAAEAALAGLNGGADEAAIFDLMKDAKQALNRIESATVNREKERANALLKDSRAALKKGDVEASKALMAETVEKFKSLKEIYLSF